MTAKPSLTSLVRMQLTPFSGAIERASSQEAIHWKPAGMDRLLKTPFEQLEMPKITELLKRVDIKASDCRLGVEENQLITDMRRTICTQ